jgi:hypothetical protein
LFCVELSVDAKKIFQISTLAYQSRNKMALIVLEGKVLPICYNVSIQKQKKIIKNSYEYAKYEFNVKKVIYDV